MNIRFQDNKRVFNGCDPTDTIEDIATYTHYTADEICKLVDVAILDSEHKKQRINAPEDRKYELPFNFCNSCPFRKIERTIYSYANAEIGMPADFSIFKCDNESLCRFIYDEVKG